MANDLNRPTDDINVPLGRLDTPQSDAAIDDIVAQEADQVLAAEDAQLQAAQDNAQEVVGQPERSGHPIFWFIIILIIIVAGIAAYTVTHPN